MFTRRSAGAVAAVTLTLVLAAPGRAEILLADSVRDFSGTQGLNGWSYGFYQAPFTASTFTPMTQFLPSIFGAGNAWYVERTNFWASLTDVGAHPNGLITSGGRLPADQWAVRRWVSPFDGEVTISGSLAKINTNPGGNGVTGRVFVDGVEVFSQFIASNNGTGVNYSVRAQVRPGSVIDFALDPTASNDAADYSRFTGVVTASAVPEPAGLALLGLGGLALLGYGGRPRAVRSAGVAENSCRPPRGGVRS